MEYSYPIQFPVEPQQPEPLLEHIYQKTQHNWYNPDFIQTRPLEKLEAADDALPNVWPQAGLCQCPKNEPCMRGLDPVEVINAENAMRLYTTYTVCPGELSARFLAASY